MIGGGMKVLILTALYFVSATFLGSFELLRVVADRPSRELMNNITMFLIWPVTILDTVTLYISIDR
jgi:hypothetical protein